MATILLSQNKTAIIDDEDLETLSQYKWHSYTNDDKNYYAGAMIPTVINGKLEKVSTPMHRFLMGLKKGDPRLVDHINRNPLDNRKSNLRICNKSQNGKNKTKIGKSSPYKGVNFCPQKNQFKLNIELYFPPTPEGELMAAKIYDEVVKKYGDPFYNLNFE